MSVRRRTSRPYRRQQTTSRRQPLQIPSRRARRTHRSRRRKVSNRRARSRLSHSEARGRRRPGTLPLNRRRRLRNPLRRLRIRPQRPAAFSFRLGARLLYLGPVICWRNGILRAGDILIRQFRGEGAERVGAPPGLHGLGFAPCLQRVLPPRQNPSSRIARIARLR